jgi:predicted porin
MRRLITLAAAAAAALTVSACITVIDADGENLNWTGENAQPFDASRDACRESAGDDEHSRAFEVCMAAKGWRRG